MKLYRLNIGRFGRFAGGQIVFSIASLVFGEWDACWIVYEYGDYLLGWDGGTDCEKEDGGV